MKWHITTRPPIIDAIDSSSEVEKLESAEYILDRYTRGVGSWQKGSKTHYQIISAMDEYKNKSNNAVIALIEKRRDDHAKIRHEAKDSDTKNHQYLLMMECNYILSQLKEGK